MGRESNFNTFFKNFAKDLFLSLSQYHYQFKLNLKWNQ